MTIPETIELLIKFATAAFAGLLIGLERERKRQDRGSIFAGVTTFPLIALLGTICWKLTLLTNELILAVVLLTIGIITCLSYWRESANGRVSGTSQITVLVTFTLGLLVGFSNYIVSLAGAVLVTGILSLRDELRILVGRLSQADLFAVLQFTAISLVIFPLVPNANYGPWGVWNPHSIWFLVVLISGISFLGYVASKIISPQQGIGLSSLIGGIVSSTAVTLAFSARSRGHQELSGMLASGVLAASSVSVIRLLVILALVSPQLMIAVLPSFFTLLVLTGVSGWLIHHFSKKDITDGAQLNNPFKLKTAFGFAAFFALTLLITRAAQVFLGEQGIYIASIIAGLNKLDAISLALAAQLGNSLELSVASRALTLALVSNTLFKTALALGLGSQHFKKTLALPMTLAGVSCIIVSWLIPLERPIDKLLQWLDKVN